MYLNAVSFVIPYKKIIVFFANFFHSLVTLLCQCPVFMAAAMCDPTTTELNSLFSQARVDMKHFEFMAVKFANSVYYLSKVNNLTTITLISPIPLIISQDAFFFFKYLKLRTI